MAGGKETPRQKMISMMYLVLTALLALNVSVEVFDAFTIVNEGIEKANINVEKKIEDHYTTFEQQYSKQPEKSATYWDAAQKIRIKTDEIITFIEKDIKLQLLLKNQGVTTEEELFQPIDPKNPESVVIINSNEIKNSKDNRTLIRVNMDNLQQKDKYDVSTNFMINENNAEVLKNKINEYRQYVISTMESAGVKNYDNNVGLRTDEKYYDKEGNELTWELKTFDKVIFPAVVSLLNEMIGEIQTTEYDAVTELFKSIGASDFKFNSLQAKVLPKSTYILSGGQFEAEVYIAGTDTERKYDAKFVRGKNFSNANPNAIQTVSSVDGVVTIKIPATQQGEQNISGIVEMRNPETGEIEPYPFETSYMVAPPSATVAPTKMNVMYRGLENPISVSAPGMASDNIEISVTNGEWRKGEAKGEYFITPGLENITTVTAYATVDGKKTTLGSYNFRIKRVPSPTPKIGGKAGGQFSRAELIAAGGLMVPLEDFDFEGYKYTVVSYDFNTNIGGDIKRSNNNKGSKFSADVKDFINASRRGQTLNFTNIIVKGSDGVETQLQTTVVVEIK